MDTHYRTVIDPQRTMLVVLINVCITNAHLTPPPTTQAMFIHILTSHQKGSSHGGLAAFYVAARAPQHCFGIAVCMSPSFWAGLGNYICFTFVFWGVF